MTSNLPIKTIQDIRDLEPCYDPSLYLPETWMGTALDILRVLPQPAADRLWVVLHAGWMPVEVMASFAQWCADDASSISASANHASAHTAAHTAAYFAANAAYFAANAAHAYFATNVAHFAAKAAKSAYFAAEANADAAAADAYSAAYSDAEAAAREKQVRELISLLEGVK